ncbi:MAG TPA: SPOR domain-containing protein [Cytophagaceae bacterium]
MKTIITSNIFLILLLYTISAMSQEVLSEADTATSTSLTSETSLDSPKDSAQPTDNNTKDIYSGRSSINYNNPDKPKEAVTKPEVKKSLISTADKLLIGYTYNRYGELVTPKGYGIQVVAFCNFNNLQKYLRLFADKDMYIQVIDYTNHSVPLYRVIIGANENKEFIEKEISFFNNAGVSAVLRKHSTANYEAYNYTKNTR